MARYFFDIHNSGPVLDDVGTLCAGPADIRREAMRILPDLIREEVPDGDRRTLSVIVRDDHRRPVFAATLSLTGLWLDSAAGSGEGD